MKNIFLGRSLRQIKRLLRLIYKPHHFYFIHVDENSQEQNKNYFISKIFTFFNLEFNN